MFAFNLNRAGLIRDGNKPVSAVQQAQFADLLQRRLAGEPIAYICGHREFWSLDFRVNSSVLIPRPDTELLVERALAAIDAVEDCHPVVADLGTGSGAVAIAIACERPKVRVVATDTSADALAVAADNARRHSADNIEFRRGYWIEPLGAQRCHVIVSNPPYVAENDTHLERDDVRHEPITALVSGSRGLDDLEKIIRTTPAALLANGALLVEHGYDQGLAVRSLFADSGFHNIKTRRDLADNERVTEATIF